MERICTFWLAAVCRGGLVQFDDQLPKPNLDPRDVGIDKATVVDGLGQFDMVANQAFGVVDRSYACPQGCAVDDVSKVRWCDAGMTLIVGTFPRVILVLFKLTLGYLDPLAIFATARVVLSIL